MIYAYSKCKMPMFNLPVIIFTPHPPPPTLYYGVDTFPIYNVNTPSNIDYNLENLTGYINKPERFIHHYYFNQLQRNAKLFCLSTCALKRGSEKSLQPPPPKKNKLVYNYTVNTFQCNSKNLMSTQNLKKKSWIKLFNSILHLFFSIMHKLPLFYNVIIIKWKREHEQIYKEMLQYTNKLIVSNIILKQLNPET